jgi:hypothetical protein
MVESSAQFSKPQLGQTMHPDVPVSPVSFPAGYIAPHWVHLTLADVFDPVGVSFRLGDLSFRSTLHTSPISRDDHRRSAPELVCS